MTESDYDALVQTVNNLLDQINDSDYVDLVGDDTRLQAVIDMIGWQPKPRVTIGMQPKWWLGKDGKLIENPDYVEPDEPSDPEPEGEPEEGTCKFSMLTGESQAYLGGTWVDMQHGHYIRFTRKPKFFDVCTTKKCEKDRRIDHQLGCVPYLIFGRADGYGWFGWLRPNPNTDVTINGTKFTNLKIKVIDDKHFVVDTDIFEGASYYYCFSEDGFTEIEDYFQQMGVTDDR